MRTLHGMVLALIAGCAGTAAPRPDDMSAAAHRAEAARERDAARRSLEEHGVRAKLMDGRVPGDYAGMHTVDEYGPPGPLIGPRGATPGLYVADAHLSLIHISE